MPVIKNSTYSFDKKNIDKNVNTKLDYNNKILKMHTFANIFETSIRFVQKIMKTLFSIFI